MTSQRDAERSDEWAYVADVEAGESVTSGDTIRVRASFTVGKPAAERVAKFCHGAADPLGSVRTWTDEETR